MSGYRDSSGHYLPHDMYADEAMDRGLGDKYGVSCNYQGPSSSGMASLLETNPHEYGNHNTKTSDHTSTGNSLSLETVNSHWKH